MSDEDEYQILRLIGRYTRAIDRVDYEALRDIYTADAVLRFGEHGSPRMGVDVIVSTSAEGARVREAGLHGNFTRHLTDAAPVDVEGDTAAAVTYYFVLSEIGPDHSGRYRDRFARTVDGWRIADRIIEVEWIADAARVHRTLLR